jgi:HlyD family secretion protein
MSYQDSLAAYGGLTVSAPISGRVTELLAAKGDSVTNGSKVAVLVDDTRLTARVPFSAADESGLSVGAPVTVTVEDTFEQLAGSISRISGSKRILDGYVEVIDVEITLSNPGALKSGAYVAVSAGDVGCYEGAPLEGAAEWVVTAKTSGVVAKLIAAEGEYLNAGDSIVQLVSDSAENS